MSIISRNKTRLISLLKFLNTKPGFRRVFYWIHEIRKDELKTDRFLAVETDDGFWLETYKHYAHRLWRNIAEGSFEPEESKIIKALLPHFDWFIDIGAHIGYYSCLVAKCGPSANIMSFEPNPENFSSLQKNLALNNAQNAQTYPVALGAKKDTVILYGIDGMGSIVKETYADEPKEQVKVSVETLDSYRKKIPQGAKIFIKIDVEGNEYFALQGAREFIKEHKPLGFIIEIVRYWGGQENPNFFKTFTMMKELGYEASFVKVKSPSIIEKITPDSPLYGSDYLFLRKDRAAELEKIVLAISPASHSEQSK